MNRFISREGSFQFRDAVSSLPRKPPQEFAKKQTIYGPGRPSADLYLVRSGRVTISSSIDGMAPTITRIVGPGGLFGEGSLIGLSNSSEVATVLDQARVMQWSPAEIEQHILNDPNLGVALWRHFVQRCAELNARVDALAFYKTPERVMLGLLQLAESLGMPNNGAMRLAPLTHQIIAEYVGTSREIVTSQMTELRRAGMLQYSRKFIDVNVAMIREALQLESMEAEPAAAASPSLARSLAADPKSATLRAGAM
jgi:CRP/FNR family cyclic AMP-dependent transcriptional regulator